jgi:hypothetical protein
MTRRNAIFVFLAFPIAILLFSIGWSLLWIDSRRKSGKPQKVPTPSILKFFVLTPEEEEKATAMHYESQRGKNNYAGT